MATVDIAVPALILHLQPVGAFPVGHDPPGHIHLVSLFQTAEYVAPGRKTALKEKDIRSPDEIGCLYGCFDPGSERSRIAVFSSAICSATWNG